MSIGERIKTRREELGMSQEDLAHKLGYKNRSSINKIELDKQNLRQTKIKAIADALDTTPAYIMGWENVSPDEQFHKELDGYFQEMREVAVEEAYSKEERELLENFRSLDEAEKRMIVEMLAFFKDQENKK